MKQKNIKERIKEYFFENPTKRLRVRQIERTLKMPLPSVIRYTKELVEEKILEIYSISNSNFFQANRTSKEFIFEKKFYNLKKIHNSDLIDELKKELSNPVIILFGSFSKGEDVEESDIDLYIEKKNIDFNFKNYEKKLGKKIEVFFSKSLGELKNKELSNNILNGNILNGFLEVFK